MARRAAHAGLMATTAIALTACNAPRVQDAPREPNSAQALCTRDSAAQGFCRSPFGTGRPLPSAIVVPAAGAGPATDAGSAVDAGQLFDGGVPLDAGVPPDAGSAVTSPVTDAEFNGPCGIAVDSRGYLYVGDQGNNRIRLIDPAGKVSTLAGNGIAGWQDGTGGANGTAEFNAPCGVAVDSQGEVYVADSGNFRVRKIDPSGAVTTLTGNGQKANQDIQAGSGGANGTTEFSNLGVVVVDPDGNPYVPDNGSAIYRIEPDGSLSLYFSQDIGLYRPLMFITFDSSGALYLAQGGLNWIERVDRQGRMTVLAGDGVPGWQDGPADVAEFNGPIGVAADPFGNVFVSDVNRCVRKINPSGYVKTLAGNGTPGADRDGTGGRSGTAAFLNPWALAADAAGNVYVVDSQANKIRKIDLDGNVTTVAGDGTSGWVDDQE